MILYSSDDEQKERQHSVINPIDNEEEEWVEVRDADGKRAAMRHIATVRYGEHTYFVLGAVRERGDGEEESGFLLVRKDEEEGGVIRYSLSQDGEEIERVIGGFIMRAIWDHLSTGSSEDAMRWESPESEALESQPACGEQHGPMEFCYCGDPEYLQ